MKKGWMNKFIRLLMEYGYENHDYYWTLYDNWEFEWTVPWTDHELSKEEIWMVIKSKEYRFIQRLVDNDKIDFSKVRCVYKDKLVCNPTYNYAGITYVIYKKYERLLMLLSIQESPIEFLISVLK